MQDLQPHNGYIGVSFFRQVAPIFIQENLQFWMVAVCLVTTVAVLDMLVSNVWLQIWTKSCQVMVCLLLNLSSCLIISSVIYFLLYRHNCFTGKYTTWKIHLRIYIWHPSGIFSLSSLARTLMMSFHAIALRRCKSLPTGDWKMASDWEVKAGQNSFQRLDFDGSL